MKHLPTWDGERASFPVWWTRFTTYAMMQEFSDALEEQFKTTLPTKPGVYDADATIAKAQKTAEKQNKAALFAFTMTFTTAQTMTLVYASRDMDWTFGLAWKIAKQLKEDFQPNDRISLVEYRRKLSEVTMKDSDEPKVMFEQLAEIQNTFRDSTFTITEEELIGVVMEKAPNKYASVITTEQAIRTTTLTLSNLSRAMTDFYRMDIKNLKGKNDKSTKNEVSVTAVDGKNAKEKCYKRGKMGHKAYQCKQGGSNNGNQNKFTGTCNHCGKVGHRKVDCWDLPENAEKRPKGYKAKDKKAAAKVGETGATSVEVLLGSYYECLSYNDDDDDDDWVEVTEVGGVALEEPLEFPDNFALLKDKDIWIGDTGASSHSTFSNEGLILLQTVNDGDRITVGNGQVMKPDQVGKLPIVMCNKRGESIGQATMTVVVYCLSGCWV